VLREIPSTKPNKDAKTTTTTTNIITMKLQSIFTTLTLCCCIISCCNAESSEPHSSLTDLLDHMLSYQQEHLHVAQETGVRVGQESDFLSTKTTNNKNHLPDLLIANSADEDGMPLPLGWEDVGKFLNEPIQSSHSAHDDFPAWQLWIGCVIEFLGVSLVVAASTDMLCPSKSGKNESNDNEERCLPTHCQLQ
jgi:hypothetical protein